MVKKGRICFSGSHAGLGYGVNRGMRNVNREFMQMFMNPAARNIMWNGLNEVGNRAVQKFLNVAQDYYNK